MTFENAAKLIKQKLTKLGYKLKSTTIDNCELFYIENYYYSINLFKIEYNFKSINYVSHPQDQFWTPVYIYDFHNLKEIYEMANNLCMDAKRQRVNKKLKELEKDFQDD